MTSFFLVLGGALPISLSPITAYSERRWSQSCPNTPMRGWSILTTIENSFSRNGPSVGDTEAINAGCLGREGDPCNVKVPNQHLLRVIKLWGRVRAFRVRCP